MKVIQSTDIVELPIVSVIIPSYNRASTVSQAIDSILNQKCNFNFEIVIGDDCSTDNAREVLLEFQKKYPQRIVLLFHEQNIGLGANWASCVKLCRGKYVANCDNDDYWHNTEKLQLQVDFMESHVEYGVCHTDFRKHNRETNQITEVVVSDDIIEIPLQKAIFSGKFKYCNATMMYRKELIDRYIDLDDYIHFQFTLQDWNTWIILSHYTNFYCLPVSTATFGIETTSITRTQEYSILIQRFVAEKKMYKYLCDRFPEDLPFDEKGYDSYVSSVLLNLAYQRKDFRKAKEFGKGIRNKSLKVLSSQYKMLFWVFVLLKRIKNN